MEKIKRVIQKLNLNVSDIFSLPDSFSSEVFKVILKSGEIVYVKIPFSKNKLFKERTMLNRLESKLPVPKLLDYWEGDDSIIGALLLSAIDGDPLGGEVSQKLSFDIGCLHARLHSMDMPGYGQDEPNGFNYVEGNDWRLYVKNNFERFKAPCRELFEPNLYEKCIEHFDKVYDTLPEPDGPCIVHLDFRPGNILVKENEVVGIIDFESARGESSEIDFTKINQFVWEKHLGTKTAFLQGYESIRPIIDLEYVLPFYSFYDSFSSIAWCKNRGIEKNRHFFENSVSNLKSIVVK